MLGLHQKGGDRMSQTETKDSGQYSSAIPLEFKVCFIEIKSSGDAYIGLINIFRFCGNKLTLSLKHMFAAGNGEHAKDRWLSGKKFSNYKIEFEGCRISLETNGDTETYWSNTGDKIVMSKSNKDLFMLSKIIEEHEK